MSLWRLRKEWIWYRKQAKINVIQALCSFIKPFGATSVRESNLGFTVLQNNEEKLHGSDDKLMQELSGLAKNNGFGKQTLTTIPLVLVRSICVIKATIMKSQRALSIYFNDLIVPYLPGELQRKIRIVLLDSAPRRVIVCSELEFNSA